MFPMRRPTRTRRLSIAAIVSLLACVVVTGLGVRSLWIWDAFGSIGNEECVFEIFHGCVGYTRTMPASPMPFSVDFVHLVGEKRPNRYAIEQTLLGFSVKKQNLSTSRVIAVTVPIWPLLLLLLIAPIRWLFARPANAPAFPVIVETTQK